MGPLYKNGLSHQKGQPEESDPRQNVAPLYATVTQLIN